MTSTTAAPAARQSHTAVWTGSEMIVWGGMRLQPSAASAGATIRRTEQLDDGEALGAALPARAQSHAVWTAAR